MSRIRMALREAVLRAERRGHQVGAFVYGTGPRSHWLIACCRTCWMVAAINTQPRPGDFIEEGLALEKPCFGVFDISGSVATINEHRRAFQEQQRASGAWADA